MALLAAGCPGSNNVCTAGCPPLEGTYLLQFPDAGLDADCQAMGVRVETGPLAITQDGPALTATFDGIAFSGLVFDTQDFTLNAGAPSDGGAAGSRAIRGHVGAGPHDGGVAEFGGNYFVSVRDTPASGAPRTCTVTRTFSAVRQ